MNKTIISSDTRLDILIILCDGGITRIAASNIQIQCLKIKQIIKLTAANSRTTIEIILCVNLVCIIEGFSSSYLF